MDDKLILARAMPPPVDVAVDGYFAGKLTRDLKQELRGWASLAVVALALAGVALILALARVPNAERIAPFINQAFFQRGLVAHVSFALVVWYVSVQGAFTVLVTAGAITQPLSFGGRLVGRLALIGATVSFLLLFVPIFTGHDASSPNDYIPVMIDPLYFSGLAVFGLSAALPILRLLWALAGMRHAEPTTFGVAACGVMFLIALACFAIAAIFPPHGFDAEGLAEYATWGGGHILQFVNTGLFLCTLFLLSRVAFGETPLAPAFFKVLILILVAGTAIGPLLYATFPPGDPAQRLAFTALYRYVMPLPTAIVCVSVIMLVLRRWHDLWAGAPEMRGLAAALVLFAYGGVIGYFESSVDTRTPAHYHAVLLAVTLAFMALIFAVFLPLLDRKTAGSEQGLDTLTKKASLVANAAGGGVAAIGGVIFIVLAARMLLAKPERGVTAAGLTGVGAA
jgi:hypothetical protein